MMQEYNNVKAYYEKLRRRIQDEEDSDDLFDQGNNENQLIEIFEATQSMIKNYAKNCNFNRFDL